jgi:chemotaxis signal transduction protein
MMDQYIVFSLAGTSYAVPTTHVAHVEMVEDVTRVPNAPPYVDGIVFSRGAVVPALNLRARFGFERAPYDTRTRLLVVQAAGRTVGLVVDSAREFQSIAESAIAPPSAGLSSLSGAYLRGIVTNGDRLIMVLDLDGLLDAHDLEAAAAIASRSSQELQ